LFRVDPEIEGKGLDYEHAVLAVGRLAKFHAVSYAYRYLTRSFRSVFRSRMA
jgi:Ecdysteroid kinase-like family